MLRELRFLLRETDSLSKEQEEEYKELYLENEMDIEILLMRLEAENIDFFWTEKMEKPSDLEDTAINIAIDILAEKKDDILNEPYFFLNWSEFTVSTKDIEVKYKENCKEEKVLSNNFIDSVKEVVSIINRDITLMSENMDTEIIEMSSLDLHSKQFMKDSNGLKIIDMLYLDLDC